MKIMRNFRNLRLVGGWRSLSSGEPLNSSTDCYIYWMLIWESWFLDLKLGGCSKKFFRSRPLGEGRRGANTPTWITDDNYKNGGEVNSTRRYSGMDVDPSGKDNHSDPDRSGDHSKLGSTSLKHLSFLAYVQIV